MYCTEYKNLVLKIIGLDDKLRALINEVPGIKETYIYGSYAKNKLDAHSDIDLLIIGKHSIIFLQKKINKLQIKLIK
jgi:predicted nucleotidyltransferase